MKTWRDLEERSLTDPLIHAALYSHHPKHRETMLITLVLALADERDRFKKDLIERIERAPVLHTF